MENKKDQLDQPAPMAVRREGPEAGMLGGGDVDRQVRTAKTFPRSISKFKQQVLEMVTADRETAASCSYAFKRGGKLIEGPSCRFYEIIGSNFGNMRVDSRTTGMDESFIFAEASCWDLESNFAVRCEVRRRITNKEGRRFSDDMVGVTGNAAVSIAFRNAVARVVPRAYINELWQASRKAAVGGQTLSQRRTEMVRWFDEQGVAEQQILDLLNISTLDDISKEQLVTLRAIATSIEDGLTSVEAIFSRNEDQPDAVPAEEKGLAVEKEKLLSEIRKELVSRWPGDSEKEKELKRGEIKIVFGADNWEKVKILPSNILEAGIKCIRERANGEDFLGQDGSAATGDDIPF